MSGIISARFKVDKSNRYEVVMSILLIRDLDFDILTLNGTEWNSLPVDLRLLSRSLRTLGHKLKHYLFVSEP